INQYVGPLPVTLVAYVEQLRAQTVRRMDANPGAVERAFRDMVLEPHTLRQLGSALVSGKAVFLYGPSGTGKTSVAETLARLFEQENVWIPHAIENDGQIITIYDPLVHQKVDDPAARDSDERWVLCRRPRVVGGGELTLARLDPQFTPVTKAFLRRIHTKIRLGNVTREQFHEISRRACVANQLPYDHGLIEELIDTIATDLGHDLRPCYPRDILNQVCWAARYERRPPQLDRDALALAAPPYLTSPT